MEGMHRNALESSGFSTRLLALVSFSFFLGSMVGSTLYPASRVGEYLSLVFHLSAFFMVPRLVAPDWARAAGYLWLGLDVTVGIMSINGVDHAITHPLRLGGHVFAAIWIMAVSRKGDAMFRLVGLMTGVCLFGFSLIAPFVPAYFLSPAAMLVMAWFCIIGCKSGASRTRRDRQHSHPLFSAPGRIPSREKESMK